MLLNWIAFMVIISRHIKYGPAEIFEPLHYLLEEIKDVTTSSVPSEGEELIARNGQAFPCIQIL